MAEIKIRLSNTSKKELRLVLEPLGEIHSVSSGGRLLLRASGEEPDASCLEVETSDDALTIYGWNSGIVEIDPFSK